MIRKIDVNSGVETTRLPTVEEIAANAANNTQPTYVELRAIEYRKKPISEQLDMQYWDSVNGTTLWRDWVSEIKLMFPKV